MIEIGTLCVRGARQFALGVSLNTADAYRHTPVRLAWAAPFADGGNEEATLYAMQWHNPHPAKLIATIDLRYEPKIGSRYGTPIVLGLSTATRLE